MEVSVMMLINKRKYPHKIRKAGTFLTPLLFLALCLGAWAQLPCPIYLGDVGTDIPGETYSGKVGNIYTNLCIDGIGDINNDFIDDSIVGYISSEGKYDFLLGDDPNDSKPKPKEISFRSELLLGISVAGIGDVNGNGWNDILLGAPNVQPSGVAYFVDGKTVNNLENSNDTPWIEAHYGARFEGYSDESDTGWSVAGAGDFNGDGLNDMVIAAPAEDFSGEPNSGVIYVVYGDHFQICGQLELERLDGSNGFILTGENAYDFAGWSVAGAGDVNGDGYDDIIIGAPYADFNGTNSGAVYIVYGGTNPPNGKAFESLGNLGTRGRRINGQASYDYFGWAVDGGQDVNNDGIDDIIIGAYLADNFPKNNVGKAYLIYGQSGGITATPGSLNGSNGTVICGLDENDYLGFDVALVENFNSDPYADVLIGAPGAYPYGDKFLGESYLIFGATTVGWNGWLDVYYINCYNGLRIYGGGMSDTSEQSGIRVASAGDMNNDCVTDIMIGSLKGGELFLIYGISKPEIEVSPNYITLNNLIDDPVTTLTVTNPGTGILYVGTMRAAGDEDWIQFLTPTNFYLSCKDEPQEVVIDVNYDALPTTGTYYARILVYTYDWEDTPTLYEDGVYLKIIKQEPVEEGDIIAYLLGKPGALPSDVNVDDKPDISDLISLIKRN